MTSDLGEVFAPQPPPGHRDWYAFEAIRAIPRIVLMVDKNPYSKTYGCFDRSFWHYRTMDFPCGMNQEFVLPLALAYKYNMPHNRYRGAERLRELAMAGIEYARVSSYPNGTTDDYFPFERAMGALVFSLYAMTESCLELDDCPDRFLDFFAKRGDWLLKHNETGKLANHQAFAALALYNVYLLTKDEKYRRGSDRFRDLTMSWRNPEGWFQEYEGADQGYHSCTIAFFAKLWQKSGDESLFKPLVEAAEFAHWFMHPDGSYAGEYGSRNTYHFYPHGFEVLAPFSRHAAEIADSFLHRAAPMRKRYFNDDDRMAAHYVYDWMHAWRDHWDGDRPGPVELPNGVETRWFPNAKVFVIRTPAYHAVVNASKGGAWKAVSRDGAFAGDTGVIGEMDDKTVVVTHLVAKNKVKVDQDARELDIAGVFQHRKQLLPTPFKQVLFRLFLLTAGRFNANFVRSALQKVLIVQKHPLKTKFRRRFKFHAGWLEAEDHVTLAKGERMRRLSAGTDATSIYVANSNTFQESVLLPWTHFTPDEIRELNRKRTVTKKRLLRPSKS